MSDSARSLQDKIEGLTVRLSKVDKERKSIIDEIDSLNVKLKNIKTVTATHTKEVLPPDKKVALFHSLFKGRQDVYPKLWTNKKGISGYSPVCKNEWAKGICRKPMVKCGDCDNRIFLPVTNEVITKHLEGSITAGVYPLLEDETCHFLAIDFDRNNWQEDMMAFRDTCGNNRIPVSIERSRSGNGGHAWVFFSDTVPAILARQMGSYLITETMSNRHELDMKSYDRFFPNQDIMPKGGFGNLIALPLQKQARLNDNTVFLDEGFRPYPDQWEYLSGIQRVTRNEIQTLVAEVSRKRDVIGLSIPQTEESSKPWERTSVNQTKLQCELPKSMTVVLANRIYIKEKNLPSMLLNQIKRLAAFQNPEFHKKQRMRLSTALTPRVISCSERIQEYLTIPRGCLHDLKELLRINKVFLKIDDKRFAGEKTEISFVGELTNVQEDAYNKLMGKDCGVCVAPPGIGKTVIGINMIAARGVNTLVLVHRKPLLEQWRAQVSSFLNIPIKDVGQIGGGKDKATNLIDVAMLQSLVRKGEVDGRIKNYGHVVVDECHHISAFSFEQVLSKANAKYVLGLTATPYRRDGHQPIIMMQCGPIRYNLKAKGGDSSVICKLIVRETGSSYDWKDEDRITSLWPQLIIDDVRNQMIFDDIMFALEEKRSPIMLTERKEHLMLLYEKLQGFVKHIILLHGGMRAKKRKEMISMLEEVPDNEERLILATGQYIGEGFDDPRLDTLFLAMPFSFKGKMVQYAGRLHRLYEGKNEVRIYDYVDENIPVLKRMFQRRLKAYKALGYEE